MDKPFSGSEHAESHLIVDSAASRRLLNISDYVPLGSCVVTTETPFRSSTPQSPIDGPSTPERGRCLSVTEWSEGPQFPTNHHAIYPVSAIPVLHRVSWIRVFLKASEKAPYRLRCRVYGLPEDVGRSILHRNDDTLKKLFRDLINHLDLSAESWNADASEPCVPWTQTQRNLSEEESLFYLFNTLESPNPSNSSVTCPSSKSSIDSILDAADQLPEIHTPLYPYQKRSAAEMIRREVDVRRTLDPRLLTIVGPEGNRYFYDQQLGTLLRSERLYEETKGGILAETMGLGKTLICLTAILATKGHWPAVPPEYSLGLHPTRSCVGSLREMAAAAVGKINVPWRIDMRDHEPCLKILEDNVGSYTIYHEPKRSSRVPQDVKKEVIYLCTATLIVVPSNLFAQWKSEIQLHLTPNALRIIYVEDEKTPFPPFEQVLRCDTIIMSKKRFEKEMDVRERREPPDSEEQTVSTLRKLHFLRLIVDEGHDFASSAAKTSSHWALQKLRVDRKWIVSGTPGQGLIGTELAQAAMATDASPGDVAEMLSSRRIRLPGGGEDKDLVHLGRIVVGFFALKPWVNPRGNDDASWSWYVLPEDGLGSLRKPLCLRGVLQGLVVRHRPEDFERDVNLPALRNEVVHVTPSWQDKLSINLFLLVLTANAVTSERVDQDYMFHPHNRGPLTTLINNLRQAGFYWTSFTAEDIRKTIETATKWLENDEHRTANYEGDSRLLLYSIKLADFALNSSSWTALSYYHEMGMYIHDFPEAARQAWSLVSNSNSDPILIGAPQLAEAQKHVDARSLKRNVDPTDGLTGCGLRTMQKLRSTTATVTGALALPNGTGTAPSNSGYTKTDGAKTPTHFEGNQLGGSALNVTNRKARLLEKQTKFEEKKAPVLKKRRASSARSQDLVNGSSPLMHTVCIPPGNVPSSTSPKLPYNPPSQVAHGPLHPPPPPSCPSEPPYAHQLPQPSVPASDVPSTTLVGTSSSKLSYLLSRLIALHSQEKSLIFYDFDNIAFYTAQALDLLSIPYLIYTGSLSAKLKNTYITAFNTNPYFRVMLMDLKQAAHGLHVASASRIFFVNPVWQPNIEAQAIKRAHRIGQKREVVVETLVLKGTLEEDLWNRRRGMSEGESRQAEKTMLDDPVMWDAIKNARFLEIEEGEAMDVERQMARLEVPQRIFGRGGVSGPEPVEMRAEEQTTTEPSKRLKMSDVGADSPRPTPPTVHMTHPPDLSPPPPYSTTQSLSASSPRIPRPVLQEDGPNHTGSPSIFGNGSKTGPSAHTSHLVPTLNASPADPQQWSPMKPKKKVGFA